MKLIVEPDDRPRAETKQPLFMNRFRRPYSTKGGFSQKREQTVIIMSAIREKRLSYIPTRFHFIGDRTLLPRKEKSVARARFRFGKNKEGNNLSGVVQQISSSSISLFIFYNPLSFRTVLILAYEYQWKLQINARESFRRRKERA